VRGDARAEDAHGTPTQSHISPRKLVFEKEYVLVVPRDQLLFPSEEKTTCKVTIYHQVYLVTIYHQVLYEGGAVAQGVRIISGELRAHAPCTLYPEPLTLNPEP